MVVTVQSCDANPHWSLQTRRTTEDQTVQAGGGKAILESSAYEIYKTISQLAQFNPEDIAQMANQSETARADVLIALGMR